LAVNFVGFVSLSVGSHMLSGQDANGMLELVGYASPVVSSATSLEYNGCGFSFEK